MKQESRKNAIVENEVLLEQREHVTWTDSQNETIDFVMHQIFLLFKIQLTKIE